MPRSRAGGYHGLCQRGSGGQQHHRWQRDADDLHRGSASPLAVSPFAKPACARPARARPTPASACISTLQPTVTNGDSSAWLSTQSATWWARLISAAAMRWPSAMAQASTGAADRQRHQREAGQRHRLFGLLEARAPPTRPPTRSSLPSPSKPSKTDLHAFHSPTAADFSQRQSYCGLRGNCHRSFGSTRQHWRLQTETRGHMDQ